MILFDRACLRSLQGGIGQRVCDVVLARCAYFPVCRNQFRFVDVQGGRKTATYLDFQAGQHQLFVTIACLSQPKLYAIRLNNKVIIFIYRSRMPSVPELYCDRKRMRKIEAYECKKKKRFIVQ